MRSADSSGPSRHCSEQQHWCGEHSPGHKRCDVILNALSLMSTHFVGNLHCPGEDLLDVVQPVGRLEVGQPPLVLDVGEAHVLDLAEALAHHVDVVNVQEDKLGTLVVILVLIPTSPTLNILG